MDARLVWDTWRRVLKNDDLVEWVTQPDCRARELDGLTANEIEIVADYSGTPAANDCNIGMYRRGLVRNALGALDLVPLTRRLLHQTGLDLEAVATDFARCTGYVDYGPNFWRNAGDFVSYLAKLPEFASTTRQDIVTFDAATIRLARELGDLGPPVWPSRVAAAAAGREMRWESTRFSTNSAAVTVRSSYDISDWIENPFEFDPDRELQPSPRHWLIYFPAADAAHEYAELSERCARVFSLLAKPMTVAELSLALRDIALDDVYAIVSTLATLGVAGDVAEMLRPVTEQPLAEQGSALRSADTLLSRQSAGTTTL